MARAGLSAAGPAVRAGAAPPAGAAAAAATTRRGTSVACATCSCAACARHGWRPTGLPWRVRTPADAGHAATAVGPAGRCAGDGMTTNLGTPPEDPAEALAEGFAQHVEGWVRAQSADAATVSLARRAALELSRATAEGHVCACGWPTCGPRRRSGRHGGPGVGAQPAAGQWRGRHARGAGRDADAAGRARTGSICTATSTMSVAWRGACCSRPQAAPTVVDAAMRRRLDALFGRDALPDWQKVAAALASAPRLVVISGGPGHRQDQHRGQSAGLPDRRRTRTLRIELAAPTGKAAARLSEACGGAAAQLPPALRDKLPAQCLTAAPPAGGPTRAASPARRRPPAGHRRAGGGRGVDGRPGAERRGCWRPCPDRRA